MTVPFQINSFDHLVIRVRDLEKMVMFYRDVLGCREVRRVANGALVQLQAGDALIDLLDDDRPVNQETGALDHFCLHISPFDPDELNAYLAAHGAAPGQIEERYGARGLGPSIYLDDPEGNRIELKGVPPERD